MPGTRSLRNRAVLLDKSNCPSSSKNIPKGNYGKKENEELVKLVPCVRYPVLKNKQLQESLTCDNIYPLSSNGNLNQKRNALRSMSQGKENKPDLKRNTRQFCASENALSKEHRVNSQKNISIVKNERIISNSKISHKNVLSDIQRCVKQNTKTALVLENRKPVKKIFPIWKKNLNLSMIGSRKPVEKRFPVWKRNLNLSKSKLGKKQKKVVDVYDIALDEEMCNEPTVKIKHTKRNIIKKKCSTISNQKQNKLTKNAVVTKSDDAIKKPLPLETKKCLLLPPVILHNPVNTSITDKTVRLDSSIESGKNDLEIVSEELMVEDVPTVEAECFIPQNFVSNFVNEFEKSLLVPKMTSTLEDKVEAEFFVPRNSLSNFVDEFEKSFPVPKMTSTPDDKGPNPQKNIANLPNVSCISFINENDANNATKTLKDSHKEKCAVNGNNISLFESPTKKKKVQKQGVIKFSSLLPQINLFDENSISVSPKKLEESVLKPRKSYTPNNNFKVHLARTKRTQAVPQKKPAKSQQDVFIEKMMHHFDELIDTDLCIE